MQSPGQFFRQGNIFRAADSLAYGHQDIRFADVGIPGRGKTFQPLKGTRVFRAAFLNQLPGPARIR